MAPCPRGTHQAPLDIQRDAETARLTTIMLQAQPEDFHRVARRDRQAQLAGDVVAPVRKRAIARAMLDADVTGPGRPRHGRPERAAHLIAQVERFARRIADRIVRPGGEPVLTAVLRPGIATAAL